MPTVNFPPVELADENGLLAVGGDLQVSTLIEAYSSGIFPWFSEGDPILWWAPSPRLVIFPDEFRIPKRLLRLVRQQRFAVTFDTAFVRVIKACGAEGAKVEKPGDFKDVFQHAIDSNRPFVIDVIVERDAKAPSVGTWVLPPFPHPEPTYGKRNLKT